MTPKYKPKHQAAAPEIYDPEKRSAAY